MCQAAPSTEDLEAIQIQLDVDSKIIYFTSFSDSIVTCIVKQIILTASRSDTPEVGRLEDNKQTWLNCINAVCLMNYAGYHDKIRTLWMSEEWMFKNTALRQPITLTVGWIHLPFSVSPLSLLLLCGFITCGSSVFAWINFLKLLFRKFTHCWSIITIFSDYVAFPFHSFFSTQAHTLYICFKTLEKLIHNLERVFHHQLQGSYLWPTPLAMSQRGIPQSQGFLWAFGIKQVTTRLPFPLFSPFLSDSTDVFHTETLFSINSSESMRHPCFCYPQWDGQQNKGEDHTPVTTVVCRLIQIVSFIHMPSACFKIWKNGSTLRKSFHHYAGNQTINLQNGKPLLLP